MPNIEVEWPDPQNSPEREFILRDCADRLSLLGDQPTVEELAEQMINRLVETAGQRVMDLARLGKVIENLAEEVAAEVPKGMYGIGKMFRGAFEQVGQATGKRGSDTEIESATNVLLDKFVGTIYKMAEVERP